MSHTANERAVCLTYTREQNLVNSTSCLLEEFHHFYSKHSQFVWMPIKVKKHKKKLYINLVYILICALYTKGVIGRHAVLKPPPS